MLTFFGEAKKVSGRAAMKRNRNQRRNSLWQVCLYLNNTMPV
ncbi:hypothetical protein HMPREF9370_2521 [Neisseria wadsworthii 9715]|uniref:Uncharacterized protein n=1 Tax=Neisseria wadsworthii 9715 TaxID=1030841 RepID=G4CTW1_9NEIS|nr:hypothetical protein HMPREF9370_2521 [Neisseria wadsworthii 9715]